MTESEGRLQAGGPTVDGAGRPTGERFVPELMGGGLLDAEHQVRYLFAAQVTKGRTVLDAGCGVGWGLELLLRRGAAAGTGIDLSPEAVAEARSRVPEATVIQGDLRALDPEIGQFGLVACFEVLEHIQEIGTVLDGLVAALAPDGLLMVSSPNPGIYRGDNPFHVHELRPEELLQEVAARLPHAGLWRQRAVVGSVLRTGAGASEWPGPMSDAEAFALAAAYDGRDQYSVVVGSALPLPVIRQAAAFTSAQQLDDLAALAEGLEQERRDIWADHERIVEERERLLVEVADLRTSSSEAVRDAEAARAALSAAHVHEVELTEELGYLRQELDRVSLLLLECEQETAVEVLGRVERAVSGDDSDL